MDKKVPLIKTPNRAKKAKENGTYNDMKWGKNNDFISSNKLYRS